MKTDDSSQPASETVRPAKEEVLAMREQVLEGMSAEEIKRLTENIKVANQRMESAYLYDSLFEKLEDKDSLYWNYFDEKGDIQVGWTFDGSYQEMRSIMEKENLTKEEFDSEYGTPVMVYNRFNAENFINLMEEMKELVQNEALRNDMQQLIDETGLAAENHEMEHASNIYKILHDMDYYLLRYGPEDVGQYVQDASTIGKYYGVLSVYKGESDQWQLQEEALMAALNERTDYYRASAYYADIVDYWENVRGVRDIANHTDFLFATDTRYYTAEDFKEEPSLVIHLAKNEIYARHGYIFKDPDLYNYFMGCIWYEPTIAPEDFDVSVLNEYERKNVKVLAELDNF
ncbi:MAG: YARHG domain-containing protein [Acetatifactor sp.]|nr:YARHG domain-containing protein [Acetatifactor sp.]